MRVELSRMRAGEWGKAALVGLATGVLLAALNVLALMTHVSPLPKPLALAFAETIVGRALPLPVGLLFHLAWVTFFSMVYVALFRDALTLARAFALAAVLWLAALAVFFPIVGLGFFGLAVGPQLIVPVTVTHALFALFLWALCAAAFRRSPAAGDNGAAGQAQL